MGTASYSKTTTIDYGNDNNPTQSARSCAWRRTNVSAKVKGSVATLVGGTKFRKATNYWKVDNWLEFGNGQYTTAAFNSAPKSRHAFSSPGGYRPDLIFANMTTPKTSVGAHGDGEYQHPVIPQGMQNEAVTKALLKIGDQKVNLGENLATLGMTARLFSGSALSLAKFLKQAASDQDLRPYLYKAYRELLRGNVPRHTANKYLEYVYGWKPLVQDVYALYKLMLDQSKSALLLNGRGASTQQATGGTTTFNDASFNSTTILGPCNERATVRASLWAQINPEWVGLRTLNQLGLLNPASLAWELTPWSFVVDWILPIGSVLNAFTVPAGLTFVDGSIAVRVSTTTPYEHWYNAIDNGRLGSNQHADGVHRGESYYRDHVTNWPLPGLWIDQDPLRGDRGFKAAALAISDLRDKRRF